MSCSGRLRKEIEDIKNDKQSGVAIELDPYDPTHLYGTIKGPDDTPYQGGVFRVDIKIPKEYPFAPPKMFFITKVYHPNVSSVTGAICLDILKDQWSPALTMKTALLSLQALLCSPEPNDPQDNVVATIFKENHPQFVATARSWTQEYAKKEEDAEVSPALRKLLDMGFPEEACKRALAAAKGDENAAIETLLSGM